MNRSRLTRSLFYIFHHSSSSPTTKVSYHSAVQAMNVAVAHRVASSVPEDEVVEDSEPEREHLRQQRKVEKIKKNEHRRPPARKSSVTPLPDASLTSKVSPYTNDEIIELSDSSDGPPHCDYKQHSAQALAAAPKTVNMAFGVCGKPRANGVQAPVPASSTEADTIHRGLSQKHSNKHKAVAELPGLGPTSQSTSDNVLSTNPPSVQTSGDASDDSAEDFRAKLEHFAYTPVIQTSNSARSSPALSRANSIVTNLNSESLLKSERPRTTKPRLNIDLPGLDLAGLRRCVSCDIPWTIRKSVAQKVIHIQSCAKKKGLTETTLKMLLNQQLERAPNTQGKGKAKDVADEVEPAPKTYLEGVLDEAAAKKRKKRAAVVSTVQSLSQTSNAIRDRARLLFSNPQSPQPLQATQAFGPSKLGAALRHPSIDSEPPQTQALGENDLAQGSSLARLSSFGSASNRSEDEDDNAPAATQAFAPSRLAARFNSTAFHNDASNKSVIDISSSSSSPFVSSSGRELFPAHPSTMDSSGVLGHHHPSPPRRTHVMNPSSLWPEGLSEEPQEAQEHVLDVEFEDQFQWANDDAYLHFDPEADNRQAFKSDRAQSIDPADDESDGEVPLAQGLMQTRRTSRDPQVPGELTLEQEQRVQKKPRSKQGAGTRKNSGKNEEPIVDDAAFENMLKAMIFEDSVLYLRILRFEPISFEIFMQMADSINISRRGLKVKVRSFLDKESINFHEAEAGGSRTKRHL